MNQLILSNINKFAPYKVEFEQDSYIFETDYGIQYSVSFDEEPMFNDMSPSLLSVVTPSYKRLLTSLMKK